MTTDLVFDQWCYHGNPNLNSQKMFYLQCFLNWNMTCEVLRRLWFKISRLYDFIWYTSSYRLGHLIHWWRSSEYETMISHSLNVQKWYCFFLITDIFLSNHETFDSVIIRSRLSASILKLDRATATKSTSFRSRIGMRIFEVGTSSESLALSFVMCQMYMYVGMKSKVQSLDNGLPRRAHASKIISSSLRHSKVRSTRRTYEGTAWRDGAHTHDIQIRNISSHVKTHAYVLSLMIRLLFRSPKSIYIYIGWISAATNRMSWRTKRYMTTLQLFWSVRYGTEAKSHRKICRWLWRNDCDAVCYAWRLEQSTAVMRCYVDVLTAAWDVNCPESAYNGKIRDFCSHMTVWQKRRMRIFADRSKYMTIRDVSACFAQCDSQPTAWERSRLDNEKQPPGADTTCWTAP